MGLLPCPFQGGSVLGVETAALCGDRASSNGDSAHNPWQVLPDIFEVTGP